MVFYIRYSRKGNHKMYGHIRCIYTVFLAGNHQIYGHLWCIYTVLANPTHVY